MGLCKVSKEFDWQPRPRPSSWPRPQLAGLAFPRNPRSAGRLSYVFFVGFLLFSTLRRNFTRNSQNSTGMPPEFIGFHRNVTRIRRNSPEFTGIHRDFIGISSEFRQNIDLEHIKKEHNHNSAFPHRGAAARIARALTPLSWALPPVRNPPPSATALSTYERYVSSCTST